MPDPVEDQATVVVDELSDPVIEETVQDAPVASRTRQQTGTSILKPNKYTMATKVSKNTAESPEKVAAIEKADVEEIELGFEGLKAVEPVYECDVEGKAHGSHMFTVEKFLASGEFDQCKSHLVLHGNEQDPILYKDKSSPTVAVHSIFVCLAAAALNGCTEAAKN